MANEFKIKNGLKVPLTGILKGNSITTAVNVATDGTDYISPASIHSAAEKTTPAGADEFPLTDSAASYALKAITYTNLKAAVTDKSVFGDFLNASSTAPVTWNQADDSQWRSGFWQIAGATWTPTTGTYFGITLAGTSNSATNLYGSQIMVKSSTTLPEPFIRGLFGGASGDVTPWFKIWSEVNHGSGSGLDADKLRGTTPTVAGLALLDDATVTAQLTTLGIHDGTTFTFDDGTIFTLPGNTEIFQIAGTSTSINPLLFSFIASPPAGTSLFMHCFRGQAAPTGAITNAYGIDLRPSWRSAYDITAIHNVFIRGESTTALTGAVTSFNNINIQPDTYWLSASIPATWNQIQIGDVTQAPLVRGIYCLISPATGKWNIYASGGAQNYFGGSVGIGVDVPVSKLHSVSSTLAQLRLGYDATYYTTFTTGSTGNLTINPVGTVVNILADIKQNGTALLTGATGIVVLTDAEYAALSPPVSTILYITTG